MSLAEYNYTITTKGYDVAWDEGEYKILNSGSGGGTFGKDNSQATLHYVVEDHFVEIFLDVVIGKTCKSGSSLKRSASGSSFDDVNGSLPEAHPYYKNFYAASAEITPIGRPENKSYGPEWPKSKVAVVFRPPDYLVRPDGVASEMDRFTSKVMEAQAEFQTSLGFFKFVGGTKRVLDLTPGQTVSASRLLYTWHQIPVKDRLDGFPELGRVPNLDTILPLVGKVNSITFDGYGPGSVLFVSWSPKLILPQVATNGNYYWDIQYVLAVRDYGVSPYDPAQRIGWNFAFDPLTQAWDLFTTTGETSGQKLYPTGDLNALFAVGW